MSDFRFLLKQIMGGRSVARAYFNNAMRSVEVNGTVIDVGAGPRPYYHNFLKKTPDTVFHSVDRQTGDETNYETDKLPFQDGAFDTVLSMNVLEHIYNHQFHFSELIRILKPEGKLVLFVPFLYMYHANHGNELLDCYRYTKDALRKMAEENNVKDITVYPVSKGMCMAAFNMVNLSLPRLLRVPLFCFFYALDSVIVRIRPEQREWFPLGYILEVRK